MRTTPLSSARPQLLLIDDDRKLLRLLTGYLQAEGFDTSVAYDGAEGLGLARAQRWDLILLDVMLPGIDGYGVLMQLRRHSQVPVLMLTGRGAESDLIAGLEGGADDYVAKTASARELLSRIRALLRRAAVVAERPPEPGNVLSLAIKVGGLRIHPSTRSVYVDEAQVMLTGMEYQLLTVLVRFRGQVRSREQLLKELGNRAFDGYDRAIDVHIASLRRKLGDDSRSARFIRTVRTVGYLFIDPEAKHS